MGCIKGTLEVTNRSEKNRYDFFGIEEVRRDGSHAPKLFVGRGFV